jgi:hypothetical protein
LDFMSLIASCADGKTLLISLRRREELKLRATLRYVWECQLRPSKAARVAPTFVLLREKVRAVRSVRATDGIVLEAQEAIQNAIRNCTMCKYYHSVKRISVCDDTQRLGLRLVVSGS